MLGGFKRKLVLKKKNLHYTLPYTLTSSFTLHTIFYYYLKLRLSYLIVLEHSRELGGREVHWKLINLPNDKTVKRLLFRIFKVDITSNLLRGKYSSE